MKCSNCQTTNTAGSRFCNCCGHELTGDRRIGIRWGLIFFGALMIAVVGVSFILWWVAYDRAAQNQVGLEKVTDRVDIDFETRREGIQTKRGITIVPLTEKNPAMVIPVGTLVIEDITGKPMHRVVVPIVDNGWIALPMTLTFGGYRWRLWLDESRRVPINGGVFRDFDRVGIWQTTLPPPETGPPLEPWNEAAPLDWSALDADDTLKGIFPKGCEKLGYFIRCDLPYGVSGPGVFLQKGIVVGWTFDIGADGAFLWNGLPGDDLTAKVRLDDYYRLTFADSREEKFLQALAQDERNDLERLDALIDAYQYPRKLNDRQLPPNLDPSHMVKVLRNLAADLATAGCESDVVNLFHRETLLEIDSPDLVIQVAELTGQVYGNDSAINTIEWVKPSLSLSSIESTRLDRVHREFYIRLLDELSKRRDWSSFAQRLSVAQTEFPDDPQLHLFEVRLALAHGDRDNAQRLLSAYTVPEALSGLVVELQSEIDRLKRDEGKIVVRFQPGSPNIRVTGELNGELSQSFLIDTGASMVTIPLSSARRLGITLDGSSPIRTVYTAGGPVKAREVVIDEITLNGQSVQRLTALVLDLPGQSNLGLLGLNYLNRFDMDLQPEKGLLTLTPK